MEKIMYDEPVTELQGVPENVQEAWKIVMTHLNETGPPRDCLIYVPNDEFSYMHCYVSWLGVKDYELESEAGAH
jgi:hypothetical protein